MNEEQAIVTQSAFIEPALSADTAVVIWDEYQDLQRKLEREGDFVSFRTKKGIKKAPTKQWRTKLERFFGLSVEILGCNHETIDDGILYSVTAKASHPKTGLSHEAMGSCFTGEKDDSPQKYHNALSHAETRAKNRAIFEFVGFGDVSAEEIEGSIVDSSPVGAPLLTFIYRLLESKKKLSNGEAKEYIVKKLGVEKPEDMTEDMAKALQQELNAIKNE